MNSDKAVNQIISKSIKWAKNNSKLVIAIDGIPGVGKSTILNLMEGKIDALLIHIDDFLTPIEYRQLLIDKGVSIEEFVAGLFDYSDISNIVEQFKKGEVKAFKTLAYKSGKRQIATTYDLTQPILIIEGTYMFNTDYFKDLWDKIIYLDGDEEEIKQRRIARTKQMMGKNFISEDDPKSFFNLGLKAFKNYREKYKPKQKADLLLTISNNI